MIVNENGWGNKEEPKKEVKEEKAKAKEDKQSFFSVKAKSNAEQK
jgi:hypothetical protein